MSNFPTSVALLMLAAASVAAATAEPVGPGALCDPAAPADIATCSVAALYGCMSATDAQDWSPRVVKSCATEAH
jgi:hypothetical protein